LEGSFFYSLLLNFYFDEEGSERTSE